MDIGKGDFVECVHAEPAYTAFWRACLTQGAVYEVEYANDGLRVLDGKIVAFVRVVGDPLPPGLAWPAEWFRRLGPKRGAFDDLLNAKPAEAPEEVVA